MGDGIRSHTFFKVACLQFLLVFVIVGATSQNVFAQTNVLMLSGVACEDEPLNGEWSLRGECIVRGLVKIPRELTLIVPAGNHLINKGAIENIGSFEIVGRLTNNGTVSNYGTLSIKESGSTINNYGTINNEGSVYSTGWIINDGNVMNNGKIKNDNSFLNRGILTNKDVIDSGHNLLNYEGGTIVNGKIGIINNLGKPASLSYFQNREISARIINEGVITMSDYSVFENTQGFLSNVGRIEIGMGSEFHNGGSIYNLGKISHESQKLSYNNVNISFSNPGRISNLGSIYTATGISNHGVIENICTGSVTGDVEFNEPVDSFKPCSSVSQSTDIELNKDTCSLDPINGQFDSSTQVCSVEGLTVGPDTIVTIAPGMELRNSADGAIVNAGMMIVRSKVTNEGYFSNSGSLLIDIGDPDAEELIDIEDGGVAGGKIVNVGIIDIRTGILQSDEKGEITNIGTIINHDRILNFNIFENINSGTVWNEGKLANSEQGTFINSGELVSEADFTNAGLVENSGTMINRQELDNDGTIDNSGLLFNTGTISTDASGKVVNSGEIKNCGTAISSAIEGNTVIENECLPVNESESFIDAGMELYATNAIVSVGDQEFAVTTALASGAVIDVVPDPEKNRLTLMVVANPSAQEELVVKLPRGLIDAKNDNNEDQGFVLLVDGDEVDYEETSTSDSERELRVTIPAGASEIDIIGTQVVPEFSLVLVIMVIAASIGIAGVRFGSMLSKKD